MTNKIGLGIIAEKFIFSVLCSLFPKKKGFRVAHVSWKRYNYGFGLDLKVFRQKGIKEQKLIGVEVKNWRHFNKPYGSKIALKEIIDRFLQEPYTQIRILVISFLSLLTYEARRLLKAHNIHVVEVGKLIGKNDFKSKLRYILKAKIQKLYKQLSNTYVHARKFCSNYSISQLHVHTAHNHTLNNTNNTIPNKNNRVEKPRNYLVTYVLSLIKQKNGEYG